jgi:hypothetical protein
MLLIIVNKHNIVNLQQCRYAVLRKLYSVCSSFVQLFSYIPPYMAIILSDVYLLQLPVRHVIVGKTPELNVRSPC